MQLTRDVFSWEMVLYLHEMVVVHRLFQEVFGWEMALAGLLVTLKSFNT